MDDQPLVSIYCATYNHKEYIRDCLEGFLMQKTTFPFEVIIHDDASTDGTQEIIREYVDKNPEIFKPIYQTVNQHQLKIPRVSVHIYPKVRGKYVGVCEGDDYWTDPEKLQKQVMMLEEHPECHLCVCGVEEVSLNKTSLNYFHPNIKIEEQIISSEQFIKYAATYSFQTSSYIMRYDDWKEYILNPPEFRRATDMGDITMLLYFGNLGKTAYIDRVMSCYRRGAPTSFSAGRNKWNEEKRIVHFEKQLKVWNLFDEYSERRFHDICSKKISDMLFGYCLLTKKATELLKKENRPYFNYYSIPKKIYILSACLLKNTMKKNYLKTMQNRENEQSKRWENV